MEPHLRDKFIRDETARQAAQPVGPRVFDAAALKMALRYRHQEGRYAGSVIVEELRTSSGIQSERFIDVWAIRPNPDKGCTAYSYEIKVSRSDFLRDLKQPLKQRGARLISDQFFFVAPPGLLKADEIPDWAGLLEPRGDWLRWRDGEVAMLQETVPAPYRSKDSPSWPLVVSLLRREAIVIPNEEQA